MGLFNVIQTAIYAQQMAQRAQLEQAARRGLPQALAAQAAQQQAGGGAPGGPEAGGRPGDSGGMYL